MERRVQLVTNLGGHRDVFGAERASIAKTTVLGELHTYGAAPTAADPKKKYVRSLKPNQHSGLTQHLASHQPKTDTMLWAPASVRPTKAVATEKRAS